MQGIDDADEKVQGLVTIMWPTENTYDEILIDVCWQTVA
jgi:hypothetical protein